MGKELIAEIGIYRRLVGARLRGDMQYRVSFILLLLANSGLHFAELATIFILFQHFESLGGWRAGEIAFLIGLASISFGIASTIASGFDNFAELVRRGGFDRLLVRPAGTIIQVLASDLELRRLSKVLQGLVALGIAFQLIDAEWTIGRLIYFPIVIVSAVVLFVALFSLEATLCFWSTESTEVINAFTYGGTQLAAYPIHIFDTWLRRLFLFIIPLGFAIYAPALYLLDKPDPLGLPPSTRFAAPVTATLFAVAAGFAWRTGVRHYRSTGS